MSLMQFCSDELDHIGLTADNPDKPNYVYRYSDCEPPAPKQTEEGIIE